MTQIKPIAMRCTKEQFNAINHKLSNFNTEGCYDWQPSDYLVNNFNGKLGRIGNARADRKDSYNRTIFEEWNEQTFLEYCGIVPEQPRMVTTVDIGAKVVRGRDWEWYDQDKGSVHGVIMSDSSHGWVRVEWISKDGKTLQSNGYRIGAENCYDLYYYEEEEFILPEKWYVQITESNRAVLEEWRKIQPGATREYTCFNDASIGKCLINDVYDGSYLNYSDSEPEGYTKITFEQFQKYVLKQEPIKQEPMKKYTNYKIAATELLKIHAVACSTWKSKIIEYLNRLDSEQNVEFTEGEINAMFDAASSGQIPVLEGVFGKPQLSCPYKQGEIVWMWDDGDHRLKLGHFDEPSGRRYRCGGATWDNVAPFNNGQLPDGWKEKFGI